MSIGMGGVLEYVRTEPALKLKERAAKLLYGFGNSGMFKEELGGAVGHLIRQDLPGISPEMVGAAMRALGIDLEYVPPTAILRDALPMMVHLRRLLLPLTGGRIEDREKLVKKLGFLARGFETPDEAAQVKLEWLESYVGVWLDSLKD